MKLVDTNVLLYAANSGAPYHLDSRGWLDASLSRGDPVGFAWLALIGFIRIVTNPAITDQALTRDNAMDTVDAWLSAPSAYVLEPGVRHASLLREALRTSGGPNTVNDAHLAAIAREHAATVVTFDADFARFPGITCERPRR